MDATETLFSFISLLEKKVIRPNIQQTKTRLSSMQLQTLTTLQEKDACTMTVLANEMHIQKQQLTPMIDKLVSEGYVQREHDYSDRRVVRISLTPLGINLLAEHKRDALTLLHAKLAYLDKDDVHCLHHALTDLSKILEKLP